MTYSTTKFEIATSYGLGGDTFTRNVADGRTHGRTDSVHTDGRTTDRLWHEINIPFFSREKSGYNNPYFEQMVGQIYPTELQLNKANSSDTVGPFLDLNLSITYGIVSSKIMINGMILILKL